MARLKVKQISDFTTAVGTLITAAASDDTASINSLELIDSKQTVDITANATAAATASSDLAAYETEANNSINSLELIDSKQTVDIATGATAAADAVSSINSIELVDSKQNVDIAANASDIAALDTDSSYRKQYATVNSVTQVTIANAVEFASDDDISVFVNGHGLGFNTAGTGGWSTTNGTVFTFSNIGYDLEDTDVVYIIAHR